MMNHRRPQQMTDGDEQQQHQQQLHLQEHSQQPQQQPCLVGVERQQQEVQHRATRASSQSLIDRQDVSGVGAAGGGGGDGGARLDVGAAATAVVEDPFLSQPQPQPQLPSRPGNSTSSIKHHPRRPAATTATTAVSFHSYLQQATKASPPSNFGAHSQANEGGESFLGVVDHHHHHYIDYGSFKSLLRNFRRRRRKIRRALLLKGQQNQKKQQHQPSNAAGSGLPIEEFEQLVLLTQEDKDKTFLLPRRIVGAPTAGDVELGPMMSSSSGTKNADASDVPAAGPSLEVDHRTHTTSTTTPYVAMADDVGSFNVGDVDDDDAVDGVLDVSNDTLFDISDAASRLRGQQQQQPRQIPPSVIYTPTPQAGNLTTMVTTTTTLTSAKPRQQKFNFNTLSRGMKRRRVAVGSRNPSPFSAALLSSPFENRRHLQKLISRREMTRRLANIERQEIIDFLDHELEHMISSAYNEQYESLTTKFIELQQQLDLQQNFELQHRQNLVVLGKELLDMYAYCTITVVVITQILQKYDAFARAYDGIPMMQYYMKNITREGHITNDSTSMVSFFYRKILHHEEVEAMCETYKNILISSLSTTSSSEGSLDRSRLDVLHLNVFETEQFFIHDIVSAARDIATSSSSPQEPHLYFSSNLPSSSPISLGYVPPTTPIGTSRPVRMSSPTFRHYKNDTTSTYEGAFTGIKYSWMKLQQYFLLGYGGEDRMIGYYSSSPSTRLFLSSSGGIVTMTGLMSDLARWRVKSEELWSEILVLTTDPENLAAVTHQGGKFTTIAGSLNALTCFSNPFEMIADQNDDDDHIHATSLKTSDKDNDPKGPHPTSDQEGQFSKQELFNLGLCLSSAGLYCLNYYIVEPSSTMYVNALGADDAVSALLIGMMPIASFGAAIVYSVWTNKAFRTPFIASCTLMLVGNIVYSSAFNFRSLPMALIGRFMTGLGGPKCIIRRYMADTTTMQQRTSVNALFGMVVAAGSALGPGCAILLNRLDFVVELPIMFRGLLRRDGGPDDEDVGSVSLFVNGMTGPGWFMALLWTLFTTCFFAMFREIPRVGLQQQLQKERQQVIATNVSSTANEDLKANEERLQQSNQTVHHTANCNNVNLVVNDSRSVVANCNSFHNPNGGEGYIDDLETLMSGKTNTTSSSSIGNQSLMTMSINDDTFDEEFDSDDEYDGDYHGYVLQNQFDDRSRYFDRDRLVKAFAMITKPIRRSFRSLLKIWNEFSRSCSRITLSVQLCLGLLFAKVFVIETLVSCTSALSKNRYGWTIKQVGMLGCVNGLSVIPLSIFVGRLSMTLQDRLLMICLLCVGVSGLCLLIDVSDIRIAFGVPEENPDAVDDERYNSGRVLAVGPIQYVIGYFFTYVSIQSFEGVIGSTLSKVIPTKLATGTFNSGLLATLVDTSGRFSGDIFISLMAMINIRQLMNLLFVPGLLILLMCLIIVRRYYDLLAV